MRHYFDEEERALRERIKRHFPHHRVAVADTDKAEENYLLYAGGDRTRGAYYHYVPQTDTLTLLAELAPWLHEEEMAEMHAVTYTTRDGLTIEAYLSLPYGLTPATARHLPVVIHPHGGPWARDTWGYSSVVQFLCNRGYAVMRMNFRGSTGYGRRFLEASYKQWGLRMQDDITDAVEWRHLRRKLRRLCHAGGRRLYAETLRLRSGLRGGVEPLYLHADHSALLASHARDDVRAGG